MTALSIIVPALNEAEGIAEALSALEPLRVRGAEVIAVDGGSEDGTADLAGPLCDRVLIAPRGRAAQMNAGAAVARGGVLLFLHADTRLPVDADRLVLSGLAYEACEWGRFDVRIAGRHPLLPLAARLMNLRSRLTAIATGDQALFVDRQAFVAVGGFPNIQLMEDIALSRRLKRRGRPLCLSTPVVTSGRRWETHGVFYTILLMWRLRLAYFLGADPAQLARIYGYGPKGS
jgi:rSAM/selenodomain-associated transferase 2